MSTDANKQICFDFFKALGRGDREALHALVHDDPDFVAFGRTTGQAVDVDGVTHLRGAAAPEAGSLVKARIVDQVFFDKDGEKQNV